MALLEVDGLRVRFERSAVDGERIRPVDDVSLRLEPGEALGLVGESGSGKSMTALALMGLLPRGAVLEGGSVRLGGRELLALPERELRRLRGDRIAIVFQDPSGALNPYLPVGLQLAEVLEEHRGIARREALRRSARALGEVGIPDPEARLAAYPHELSGGMRQRVAIAMALLCEPEILIADEPTTALDATLQAQVLELFAQARRARGTALLLITHDLGVVARSCDRVSVMYAGRLVETAELREVFARPLHPYTLGLLESAPRLAREGGARPELPSIPGLPPDLARLPAGCAFHPRCSFRIERCGRERPSLQPFMERPRDAAGGVRRLDGPRRAACHEKERLGALARPQVPA
ncbi:MAG TPA: ABC transporter ATP-binding protein [Planctomycetota bacterium]|nr:ABC transporter ATP-binding protein [Planctomycetota bacterium]